MTSTQPQQRYEIGMVGLGVMGRNFLLNMADHGFSVDGYNGIELGAIWDDVKFGIKHRNDFIKVAAVGAPRWMDWVVKASSAIMSGEVRTFSTEHLREALDWVNT
jgi:6-phosphogluconate dehydrogenase